MNILVSSTILSLALILLADSIRQLAPRNNHKKHRPAKKSQPTLRAQSPGVDLRMTDLRRGGGSHD